MKTWLLTGSLVFAAAAGAADVTIYMNGTAVVPNVVDHSARAEVTWMFSQIGIRLAWSNRKPARGAREISVNFTASMPARLHPGALAFATPFAASAPTITVLYDRLANALSGRPCLTGHLLAHTLAHEIGHILKGNDVHEDSGVMKAHWTQGDFDQMARHPLCFTRNDIELMRQYHSNQQNLGALRQSFEDEASWKCESGKKSRRLAE